MEKITSLAGRVMIAVMFLMAGIGKLGAGYAGTQQYMASMGIPGGLLPLVIALEIGGALLLIVGCQTRWAALALAIFTLAAGIIFHYQPGNQMQMIMFMKNIAIAGGLLILAGQGAGAWSVEAKMAARKA